MKITVIYWFALFVLLNATGCSSVNHSTDDGEMGIEYHSFIGPKKSRAELKSLRDLSRQGDGQAAYALYAYYTIGAGQNSRLGERYLERAVELEWPVALFDKGLRIWSQEEQPDVDLALQLVSRAIELGHTYQVDNGYETISERDLLEEIQKAKESGVIPRRSNFRLFPDQVKEAHDTGKDTQTEGER